MRIKWEEVFGGLKEAWSKRELRCAEGCKCGENQKNTKVLKFRDISERGAPRRKIRYSRAKIGPETVKYFDKTAVRFSRGRQRGRASVRALREKAKPVRNAPRPRCFSAKREP